MAAINSHSAIIINFRIFLINYDSILKNIFPFQFLIIFTKKGK